VGSSVFGGSAAVGDAAGGWGTDINGVAGTVTITALTGTRMAGTFEFVAIPSTGSAAGEKVVTNGQFDIAWSGTPGVVPANAGGWVRGTVDGTFWNAATVVVNESSGNFTLLAGNFESAISINLNTFTGEGPYPLTDTAPLRTLQVSRGTDAWGFGPGTSGSIIVTSATDDRVAGTFSGTLGPIIGTTATAPITVGDGSFDVGRP
jgi:hypothetical protein